MQVGRTRRAAGGTSVTLVETRQVKTKRHLIGSLIGVCCTYAKQEADSSETQRLAGGTLIARHNQSTLDFVGTLLIIDVFAGTPTDALRRRGKGGGARQTDHLYCFIIKIPGAIRMNELNPGSTTRSASNSSSLSTGEQSRERQEPTEPVAPGNPLK